MMKISIFKRLYQISDWVLDTDNISIVLMFAFVLATVFILLIGHTTFLVALVFAIPFSIFILFAIGVCAMLYMSVYDIAETTLQN